MSDFLGSGRRLAPKDFRDAADLLGVREAHIRTIFEVECNGSGFDSTGRPEILFERHIFYRQLGPGPKRDRAVREGLAYPVQGTRPYIRGAAKEWEEFFRAYAIDREAAVSSASWGLGQIMGFNHAVAGYGTAEEMALAFAESEREQLFAFCRLVQSWNLVPVMLEFPDLGACRKFAKRYNGPKYEKNRYHTKLADAFRRWSQREKRQEPMDDEDGVLRVGSKGERVKALQQELKKRNYYQGKLDGVFGSGTRNALVAWKMDNDLLPIPMATPEEMVLLERSPRKPVSAEREETTVADLAKESDVAWNADVAEKVVKYGGPPLLAAKGAEQVGLLDQAEEVADKVDRVSGIWDTLSDVLASIGVNIGQFLADHALWIVGGGVLVVVVLVHRAKQARLQAERNGDNL